MSEPLLDPQLEAFYAQDPAHFLERGPIAEPLDPSTPPHARVAIELAVAFLVARGLAAKYLAGQDPRLGEVPVVAGQAWRHHAPIWLRFAVPAIRQAYALGEVEGLSEAELEQMATEYAQSLGEYLDESSAEALLAGFTQQLNGRWNEQLAWQRAATAYGLDKQQMRSYIGALMSPGEVPDVDPVPVAARLMADKLLTLRAQTMGETEGWRAGQSGKAIAWMIRQQRGELPADALREWDNRNEQACKACRALHGQRVLLTEPFIHPVTGEQLWAPGAHPRCKCELALVLWRPRSTELGMAGLSKALGPDPYDRDTQGRFSAAERRGTFLTAALGAGATGLILHRRRGAPAATTQLIGESLSAAPELGEPSSNPDGWPRHQFEHQVPSAEGPLAHHPDARLGLVNGSPRRMPLILSGREKPRDPPPGLRPGSRVSMFQMSQDAPDARLAAWNWAADFDRVRRLREGSDVPQMSEALHAAVANAPANAPRLYRSVHAAPDALAQWGIGDEITMPLSSFTEDPRIAADWSDAQPRSDGRQVIFHVPPGSAALDIDQFTPFPAQSEWIGGGKYKIIRMDLEQGVQHVHLQQLGRLGWKLAQLGKRLGEDPYDRDKQGRFAATEHRAGRRVTHKEPIQDPVVEEILRQVKEGHDAFGVPSHAKDLFASPFAGPPKDLFATPRDPFRRPRDPFGVERGPARSLFDQRKRQGSLKDRSQLKRVIHHVAVPLPKPGEAKERNHEPYYLPAEELHNAYEDSNGEVLWGPGDRIDLTDANAALRNYSNYTDSPAGEPMTVYAVRADHPMELLEREQPWVSQALVDQKWAELLPALRHAQQQAIAHADDLVERLGGPELRNIFAMAGYDTREEPGVMRARIVRAVHGRDGGDDSLAGAYVDHIAWSEPELLGDQGVELARITNDGIHEELIVFGAEHNQFFVFENGFHDGSEYRSLGRVVDLHSDYVASHVTYHSALMEKGSGAEPFVVGWREISMVPADAHGKPLPRE